MKISAGFWQTNTDYSVSCTVTHKVLPEIFTHSNSTSFNTSSPPYGGRVETTPEKAYPGESMTFNITGWQSPNPPLNYLLFNTKDIEGNGRGGIITEYTKESDTDFTFALPENPILVVIADSIGEVYTEVVKVAIIEVEEPAPEGDADGAPESPAEEAPEDGA